MDSHAHLRALLDGVGCGVCGDPVGAEGIRVLADREELAFVELACPGCGSTTLAIVTLGIDDRGDLAIADDGFGEFGPGDERLAGGPPIGPSDVLAMHELLAGYRGDLRGLLGDGRDLNGSV
jgi:hypothetical protein